MISTMDWALFVKASFLDPIIIATALCCTRKEVKA
jgi:hypothetical protein